MTAVVVRLTISGITRALLTRWYGTLTGLLLTVGLCVAAGVAVPPTYESKAEVLLVPPATSQLPNPYLGLGGLQEATDVLARALSDATTLDAIKREGSTGTFTVARDTSTGAPILQVVAANNAASGSLQTLKLVLARLSPTLKQLQAGVVGPRAGTITLTTLNVDQKATTLRKTQTRAVIGALFAGLVITLLLVGTTEKLLGRRARRKADQTRPDTQPGRSPDDVSAEPGKASPGASGSPQAPVSERPEQRLRGSPLEARSHD